MGSLIGLLVQAVYQSLLQLSWIDKLLDNIRILFVDLYGDQVRKPHSSVVECDNFDGYFDQRVKELEGSVNQGILPDSTAEEGFNPSPGERIATDQAAARTTVPRRGMGL